MSEDAGSIYSEVRIRLDKLQSDITQAVSSIDRFGGTVVDMSNTTSNLFSNNYSKSIQNVKTYLASLDGAVKSGAMTQQQAIAESIAARKQELSYIAATAAKKGGYTAQEISDSKTVRAELSKLETQYKTLDTAENKAGTSATSFSAASVAAAAVVALAFRSLVTATSDYSAALAGVRAATRGSTEEMDQFAMAADLAAKQYGKTNAEALQGIEALAKAGVSTADILGGGLDGAMALAAAGEMDVGAAAEAAAGLMTQFGKTGADVTHIADLLAAAAGNAQGEVSDFTMAFKQVGLVASKTGLSIEDTTGTLAAFASNSLLGSDAGTSLKTMLAALTPVSAEAGALMKKLGFAAYDAQGNFVGISDVAEQLKTKLGGLTEAEKSEYLQTLFGNDGKRAAIVLMEQGGKGIDDWIGKVNDQGFAAETARIKMDSLDGDLKKLDASTKNVAASLGDAATPAMRGMAQVATTVLNAISALPGPVKTAIITIAGLAGGLIAFAAAGPAVIGVIKGIGLAVATSLGPVGLIASAIGILAVGLTTAAVSAGAFENSTDRLIRNSNDLVAATKKSNDEFTKIVGPTNDATRAQKLSADQIDQLKKLYPELTRTMDLNKATIGQVTEAQKKLNAERNKDALSAINAEIKVNNDAMAANTKRLADNQKATGSLTDMSIKSREKTIASYLALKAPTERQTELYRKAVQELATLKSGEDDGNKSRQESIAWTNQQNAKIEEQNKKLRQQIKELDGTADAERAAQAAAAQAAADKKAATEAAKQAIEREIQARKDLLTEYDRSKAVFKAMLDAKLMDEEEYLSKIVELSNGRITQIQNEAVKDGQLSKEKQAAITAEMAIRDQAAGKLKVITDAKQAAIATENQLQSALDGTVESMQIEIAALEASGNMTEAQTARRDLLAKKIKAIQDKGVKDLETSEDQKKAAMVLTDNFRQSMADGEMDAIDAETAKKKTALDKEVSDLMAANALRLASDKTYADQSVNIAKYQAAQIEKIDMDSLTKRVQQVGGYASQVLGMFASLFSAIGQLQQAQADAEMEALDAKYEHEKSLLDTTTQDLLDSIDTETQARLVAAGIQDKTAVESAQEKLDAAVAAGDAEAIDAAQKELEKQTILAESEAAKRKIMDDAAAAQLAADKAYQKEKAQMEYKAAKAQWENQLLNATVAGAQSIISGLSAGLQIGGWPGIIAGIAMMALAGITMGVQLGTINANKPKPPALASGGIAIPSASGGGAEVLVAENGSPEMMLNGGKSGEAFLNKFADAVAARIGQNNGGITATIVTELDSVIISKAVARNFDNGTVRVKGLA
jgi:TP901 family phage tail tape measure protein